MSRWLPDARRLVLGVDRQSMAWRDGSAANGVRYLDYLGSTQLAAPVRQPLGQPPGGSTGQRTRAEVFAGCDLAVYWVQSPPTALASFAELRLVAQSHCAYLYGGAAGDWQVAADWQAGRPFVCAALPSRTVSEVDRLLTARGVRARWHTVWSSLVGHWPGLFPDDGWCVLRSATRLLVWCCRAGLVRCLANLPVVRAGSGSDAQAQARQWAKVESVRLGQPAPDQLHWLDLGGSRAGGTAAGVGIRTLTLPGTVGGSDKVDGTDEAGVALALGLRLQGAGA